MKSIPRTSKGCESGWFSSWWCLLWWQHPVHSVSLHRRDMIFPPFSSDRLSPLSSTISSSNIISCWFSGFVFLTWGLPYWLGNLELIILLPRPPVTEITGLHYAWLDFSEAMAIAAVCRKLRLYCSRCPRNSAVCISSLLSAPWVTMKFFSSLRQNLIWCSTLHDCLSNDI